MHPHDATALTAGRFCGKMGAETEKSMYPILSVRLCAQDGGHVQNKKSPPFVVERQDTGAPGEHPGALLGHFLGRAKKWHKNESRAAHSSTKSRWAVCASKEQVV